MSGFVAVFVVSCLFVFLSDCRLQKSNLGYSAINKIRPISFWSTPISSEKHPFLSQHPFGVLSNCTQHYITQYLDHFNWRAASNNQTTYKERYFICGGSNWTPNSTIFFYTGNEANVELYVNNTGLMWENADEFNAIMVFAEHRYFGDSLPFGFNKDITDEFLFYLSADQALADFAVLINYLKIEWNSWSSPVIGFGGSYGGMLCTWFRIKYPQWMDGCIAGSAPIVSFMGQQPSLNPNFFADGETYDCSIKGGNENDWCWKNIQKSWQIIFNWSETEYGRHQLSCAFRLCSVPQTYAEGVDVAYWVSSALSFMTMGSYPYASSYMLNGNGILPPYPMKKGCSFIDHSFEDSVSGNYSLLTEIRNIAGIFYNYSDDVLCYDMNASANNETEMDGELWNYLYCSEIFQPFGTLGGTSDMFWYSPWNVSSAKQSCMDEYGIETRAYWAATNFGAYGIGHPGGVTNIVFSNGELDPWRGGGIQTNLSESLLSIVIAGVGHHIDLMFSHENDTQAVKNAREFELDEIRKWVS